MIEEAIIDIVIKTGIIFIPLFFSGFIGWIMATEVILYLFHIRSRTIPSVNDFKNSLKNKNFSSVEASFKNKQHPYYILLKGLYDNQKKNKKTITYFYNEVIINYLSHHFLRLTTVKILAALAPLLGLLGTVNGMVSTFNVISYYGNSNASLLAEGISEALMTTQAGLTISFPLLLIHVFLKNKLNRVKRKIDSYYNEFCHVTYH